MVVSWGQVLKWFPWSWVGSSPSRSWGISYYTYVLDPPYSNNNTNKEMACLNYKLRMLFFFLQRFGDSSSTLGWISTYQLAAHFTSCQRWGARQDLTQAFSELQKAKKRNPNAYRSPANARTFLTRDFTATCDTTGKSYFMCASGDSTRSKHAFQNGFKNHALLR